MPLIVRFFAARRGEPGSIVGQVYALNTAGAVLGAGLTGFVLLPTIGVKAALLDAAALNLAICCLILIVDILAVKGTGEPSCPKDETNVPEMGSVSLSPRENLVIFLFAVAGFASMVYEVAWTRALCLSLGSSVYAFSVMLATFLFGIGLGSFLFSRMSCHKAPSLTGLLGWVEIGIGLSGLLLIPGFSLLPVAFLKIFPLTGGNFPLVLTVDFALCFLAMLLPTVLMGFAFPAACEICTRGVQGLGQVVGKVYSSNTLGCIAGSFAAGFFLIPSLGLEWTMKVGVAANLAAGAVLIFLSFRETFAPGPRAMGARVLAASVLVGSMVLCGTVHLDKWVLSSGAAVYANSMFRATFRGIQRHHKNGLLSYRDGISSTVTVYSQKGEIFLRVNGKTDASSGLDAPTQLLLGYIPLVLAARPVSAVVIGLGSGMTLGALAQDSGIKKIECVEIEPAVATVNHFFSDVNHRVLSDPRVKIVFNDGRNHLLASPGGYDIIISEPSNPWIAGVADLFSLDFYRICRERLRPNGVMCQWFHLYTVHPDDLRMVVRTFREAFPHTQIWLGAGADIMLLGSKSELTLRHSRLLQVFRIPSVRKDLEGMGISSGEALLSHFLLNQEDLTRFSAAARLNTDDLPLLEYSAPKALYRNVTAENLVGLLSYQETPFPPVAGLSSKELDTAGHYFQVGRALRSIGQKNRAFLAYEAALKRDPDHFSARLERVELLLDRGLFLPAKEELDALLKKRPREKRAWLALGRLLSAQGNENRALGCYERARKLGPRDFDVLTSLTGAYETLGKWKIAAELSALLQELKPDSSDVRLRLARNLYQSGAREEARAAYEKALALDPDQSEALWGLGNVYFLREEYKKAIYYYDGFLQDQPNHTDALLNLGGAYLQIGLYREAETAFKRLLAVDPYNRKGLQNLEILYDRWRK
ncbi:MAG: fused MFS/spermidine synthase [Armatimonadetes bacterium]|nr:fused MFS/spermidine synthase [Armatimonadota bacterium]